MGATVFKPSRDDDWYVYWSDTVEAPLAFGDRAFMAGALARVESRPADAPEVRLERADRTGTSALWPSPEDPYNGWQERKYPRGVIYQQRGWLPMDRMRALCERIRVRGEDVCVRDLLDPFEDGEDRRCRPGCSCGWDTRAAALDRMVESGQAAGLYEATAGLPPETR